MGALWHHLPEHEPVPSDAEHRRGNRSRTSSVIGSAFARKCWQVADHVGRAAGAILVLRRNFIAAAAGVLVAATMTPHAMAFNHGTWGGGAHFVRGGFGQPIRRRFAFRRGFAFGKASIPGGLWPYYGFDYVPTDTLGDIDAMTYGTPEAIGALPAPACHRSEEMVTVPSEGGGTRPRKPSRAAKLQCLLVTSHCAKPLV